MSTDPYPTRPLTVQYEPYWDPRSATKEGLALAQFILELHGYAAADTYTTIRLIRASDKFLDELTPLLEAARCRNDLVVREPKPTPSEESEASVEPAVSEPTDHAGQGGPRP